MGIGGDVRHGGEDQQLLCYYYLLCVSINKVSRVYDGSRVVEVGVAFCMKNEAGF